MKAIYEFYWDCGRMGNVTGTFVAKKEDVEKSIGKTVYFGEILGKHSEIYGTLEWEDLSLKSDDQEFIKTFEEIMGKYWSTGYDPLEYISEDDGEEDEE